MISLFLSILMLLFAHGVAADGVEVDDEHNLTIDRVEIVAEVGMSTLN